MVRLKAGVTLQRTSSITFQFLHGAIKSWGSNSIVLSHQNFNSYMVRLKAHKPRRKLQKVTFQFLHGAIKRDALKQADLELTHFNSYMVRLKGDTSEPLQRRLCLISIPTWCD